MPTDVLAAWPAARPLVVLWSGDDGSAESRWTIMAQPREVLRCDRGPGGAVRCRLIAGGVERELSADPLEALRACIESTASTAEKHAVGEAPPFRGGWIGALSYELGHLIEPAALRGGMGNVEQSGADRWPLMEMQYCPAAYCHDNQTGVWWRGGLEDACGGDAESLPEFVGLVAGAGGGGGATAHDQFELGTPVSLMGEPGYREAVARCVRYIHDGDIFQANIAHRLRATFSGSARALFLEMASRMRPRYGAYLERVCWGGSEGEAGGKTCKERRVLASVSPELFLDVDLASGRVVTRPIKGTRPAGGARGEGEAELDRSEKDRAELAMIVDLMRNDLGRVSRFGTIKVEQARQIEAHGPRAGAETDGGGGVLHAVATVSGVVRSGVGVTDLLRATFPAGSITGAPKVRSMQVIRELEPVARGPYCGSIGYISDHGHAAFNVAIRTACIEGTPGAPGLGSILDGLVEYGVGAGIVAESDPESEWRETLDKAGGLLHTAAATRRHPCGATS
ncbi:MAG: anthranilate synthase component I family protein [Phycisphaerales bacterium]|nr:anthranilate synthase component I family protein [Phycisphaerales bacterium]